MLMPTSIAVSPSGLYHCAFLSLTKQGQNTRITNTAVRTIWHPAMDHGGGARRLLQAAPRTVTAEIPSDTSPLFDWLVGQFSN
ncbi:hypothetical protein A3224_05405 [Microbulbifer thermotolerans]|uniref:Uncharacterized protein n=1 Tax=Microbulbifer thermotolerans TaxID=252514 RepID=A0A143HKQ9_MICTH|nr:hypothetical protein A3224_05405 [Microbulbifer thermotolerans]